MGCKSLHTISIHQNPMTVEELRDTKGFEVFDERRKAKYSKQVAVFRYTPNLELQIRQKLRNVQLEAVRRLITPDSPCAD